jgi:hydroxylamine reductase (hybrid-cluster protein)
VAELLAQAEGDGISTAFGRSAAIAPRPIGEIGQGYKNCHMGPCRLVKPGEHGACGATLETLAAQNLARSIAAGAQPIRIMAWMRPTALYGEPRLSGPESRADREP